MSISIKKVGNRKYAYLAYRNGDKVVQRYLGPAHHPDVIARQLAIDDGKMIPARLYHLFWDVDAGKLNLRRHSRYVIERILELGDLDALWWAQRQYPTALIIETCHASRRLSPRSKNFWELWLEASHAS